MEAVSRLVLDGECAVEAVIHDVESRKGELGADLVGDAGEDRHLEKRTFLVLDGCVRDGGKTRYGMQGLETRDLRCRQPVVMSVDHPAKGERRVVNEVVLECASDGYGAFDECEVGLLHGLCGELGSEVREGFCGAGDQDESRGVRVDAVESAGHQGGIPEGAAFRVSGDSGVHQCPGFTAGEGLDGHAGGLVEGEEGVVLEDAGEATRFGSDETVGGFKKLADDDRLAAAELETLRSAMEIRVA